MSADRPTFDAYRLPLARRREAPAAVAALLLHAAVIALFVWGSARLLQSAAAGAGPLGGGEPASAVSFLTLPPPSVPLQVDVPAPAPLSLRDVPSLEPLPLELAKILIPEALTAGAAAGPAGAARRGGPGAALGPGSGDGGPGTGTEAGYIFPASPRWAIVPPMNRPASVRGRTYRVHFWVTTEGRVSRVEVTPDIPEPEYRREFIARMMGYVFTPATTRNGERIASVYSITLTL